MTRRQSWAIRIGSLLIPLAHAAGQNVVTVLGLRFMTDSLAISAGAAGFIFSLVKIYDGFLDPAVGAWSDRIATPWGRRLPFLFMGGLAMPLGIAMLFGAPDFGSILLAQGFVTVALIIHATGYTLLTIPGFAMAVESSSDPHERTRLMGWRGYGTAIGTLIGSTVPAWLLSATGPTRSGHLLLAAVVGAIVLGATLLAVRLLRHAPRTAAPGHRGAQRRGAGSALLHQLALAWNNRPFRVLAGAHVFVLFGTAIGSAALAYFTRIVLDAGDDVLGTYFMLATIAMVAAMPAWVWISGRIGKKACYMASMGIFGLVQLSWLAAGPGESAVLVGLRGLIGGAAGSGMILCAYALLSDAVRYDYIQSGERREGAFAGFTTLFDKLSAAAALVAMGSFLGAMGYQSSHSGMAVAQDYSAVMAVRLCESVIPALSMLAAIAIVTFYDLEAAGLEALENTMQAERGSPMQVPDEPGGLWPVARD